MGAGVAAGEGRQPGKDPADDEVAGRWATWRAWHPVFLLSWAAIGVLASELDRLHEAAGVIAYPNPDWIGCRLPVSPAYVGAGLAAYAVHALLFGVRPAPRGILGGAPIDARSALQAAGEFALAYALTALASARALSVTAAPFVCGALLGARAATVLWRAGGRVILFAALAATAGVAFEWTAVARGGFAYTGAGSTGFFGTPVPLVWLPLLYMHAAIAVHRLLRGARPALRLSGDPHGSLRQ